MINKSNKIKQNVPLAPLTTFKIGGPAEFFVEAVSENDLTGALAWAEENKQPVTILAGGSNVLVSDRGIKGLVIRLNNCEIEVKSERLVCGAGASLMQAANQSSLSGLTGMEWAIGIPGSVGGAIRGNSGAHGGSMADIVEMVLSLKKNSSKIISLSRRDCGFGYKDSLFVKSPDLIIWQAIFKLKRGDPDKSKQLLDGYVKARQSSQPKLPSAGCVFKNLNLDQLAGFNRELAQEAEDNNMAKNGKVSAGWLIDLLGLKGKSIGGAKVSLEHANFIVNTGNATAEDVVMLVSLIKQQVRSKLKVQLAEEIQFLGF